MKVTYAIRREYMTKLMIQPDTVPITDLKYKLSVTLRCNPGDIRFYYGSVVIENNRVPSYYEIYPRDDPWDIYIVLRKKNGKWEQINIAPENNNEFFRRYKRNNQETSSDSDSD